MTSLQQDQDRAELEALIHLVAGLPEGSDTRVELVAVEETMRAEYLRKYNIRQYLEPFTMCYGAQLPNIIDDNVMNIDW